MELIVTVCGWCGGLPFINKVLCLFCGGKEAGGLPDMAGLDACSGNREESSS